MRSKPPKDQRSRLLIICSSHTEICLSLKKKRGPAVLKEWLFKWDKMGAKGTFSRLQYEGNKSCSRGIIKHGSAEAECTECSLLV